MKLILTLISLAFSIATNAQQVYSGEKEEIDKDSAITIAREANFFEQNHWLFPPKVEHNENKKEWIIESMLRNGVSKDKCKKKCISCIKKEIYTIKIDARSGKIKRKKRKVFYVAIID